MNIVKLVIIGVLMVSNCIAQDFSNYQTLLSKGDMPEDFKLLASEKYKKELDGIKQENETKKDKKRKRNFALESNFALTDMMMSGRVIYGDELGDFINKIADLLLKDNKVLRKELRFYILKSTVANAFSTNQGMIFITTGLIAQVENEAQLAYIISHEIVHYTKKHNYEQFKKREAILSKAGRSSTVTIEEKLRSVYKYSKNNETEADEKGMELFLKTKYNPFAAISSYDVLLYSYLPYDIIEWKPSVFENEYYKFPETYSNMKLTEISADEDEDDEEHTHPNIGKRKTNMVTMLENEDVDSTGKSWYLVSKETFTLVQKIARFELASLYLKSGNPAKAYYIAYLLDNTYGANTYTDKIKSMSIYSMSHHLTYNHNLNDYGCNDDDYEGEVQLLAKFFSKLKNKELSILASKYLYEMSVKYPEDQQIKRICDQTFTDMLVLNKVPKSGFTNYLPPIADTSKAGNSKVDKLKFKQKDKNKTDKYYYGAFYKLLEDRTFKKYLTEMAKNQNEVEEGTEEDEDAEDRKKETKSKKQGMFAKDEDKKHDEIVSLVLFNPDYNARYNNKVYLLEDEATQNEILNYYKTEALRSGVEISIIDKTDKDNFDTETFNKFALLNDWLVERVSNDTLTMELYQKEFITFAFKDYKTKYLGWTGYKYTENRREFEPLFLVGSIFLYPLFPVYLHWQLSKDKSLENLLLVYDVETGKPILFDYHSVNKRPKGLTIQAIIYNQLYDLKNGK